MLTILNKFSTYTKRYGFGLFPRAMLKTWRRFIDNKIYLFCLDKTYYQDFSINIAGLQLKSFSSFTEISHDIYQSFCQHKGGDILVDPFLHKFFNKGAELWIVLSNNTPLGYHWSSQGGLEGFYYMPVLSSDAILFASEVFHPFRGQGINPWMIMNISQILMQRGSKRVFIGCSKWNKSQIRSISKTGFKWFGTIRVFSSSKSIYSIWYKKDHPY